MSIDVILTDNPNSLDMDKCKHHTSNDRDVNVKTLIEATAVVMKQYESDRPNAKTILSSLCKIKILMFDADDIHSFSLIEDIVDACCGIFELLEYDPDDPWKQTPQSSVVNFAALVLVDACKRARWVSPLCDCVVTGALTLLDALRVPFPSGCNRNSTRILSVRPENRIPDTTHNKTLKMLL